MFDTERLTLRAMKYAGAIMGYDIPEDVMTKVLGLNMEKTRQVFENELADGFDFDVMQEHKVKFMFDHIENNGMPIKAGLNELLEFLKYNGYKMTVATSTDKKRAEYYFLKAGISGYFDKIVCGDMIKRGKPEPDIYLEACRIIGLAPGDCMALEDSPHGIMSAFRAGMKTVMIPDLIRPDEQTRKMLYAQVSTLFDVIELLR